MAPRVRIGHLDGAWWPQSAEVVVEVTDLVDNFPEPWPLVARVALSGRHWNTEAIRVRVPVANGGTVKVSAAHLADPHTALVFFINRLTLRLAVVPPSFTVVQGRRVLAEAAEHHDQRSATALLASGF